MVDKRLRTEIVVQIHTNPMQPHAKEAWIDRCMYIHVDQTSLAGFADTAM